ncbi:MAG: pyridoxamine 5'-phosphate oxidase [Chitinophagales bacterium]|nr:pyridoxamine 5'-phosphate oxidase [Chitinophagales bacterium]MDW8393027.1 pyridoxamine 5'-phosphate oxidase [Chitinophagales bacterium]
MNTEGPLREALQQRRDYQGYPLREAELPSDPLVLFEQWFADAVATGMEEPHAMTLATCSVDFKPSCRVVLLKDVEDGAFVFYTNYESRKGKELLWNPYAALLFYWPPLSRQVRIEGRAEKLEAETSDAYFASRPTGSQVAAVVSPQSAVIDDLEALRERCRQLEARQKPLSRPSYWGGYRIIPYQIEFWQGQPNRLHDRIRYVHQGNALWKRERLAP